MKDGQYLCAIIGAEEKTSKRGSEMIELKCEAIGPNIEEEKGSIFYDYLVFSESSFWKIDDFRRAIGETIVEGAEVSIEADDLIGKTFEAHLISEGFNGKDSNKIGKYVTGEGEAASEDASDDIPF